MLSPIRVRSLQPTWLSFALLISVFPVPCGAQQPSPPAPPVGDPPEAGPNAAAAAASKRPSTIRFSFDGAPWREVITWLARQANLALHVSDLPTGSFTYSDPSPFSHDAAIGRVNLFLLPEGFTLIRSGRLLSVINLTDPRSMKQLDTIAKLVPLTQLDQYGDHDVVKCLFQLGDITPADAVEELTPLKLLTNPAIFSRTNQLMITDTVANLKNVQAILDSVEPGTLDNGMAMRNFKLEHVDAEDILTVVRPHLGLATGEMIGIDVSMSADLQGKNIFVTGLADKVKLIEGLIGVLDLPEKSLSTTDGETSLRSHRVAGGNLDTVYNVLITLLAGKPVRLSIDASTSSLVALASPEIHAEIAETVEQLQAADTVFEVIQLKTIDPYFAISLLEQMLDIPDPLDTLNVSPVVVQDRRRDDRGRDDRRRDDRRRDDRRGDNRRYELSPAFNATRAQPPKIDADPATRRLFVRATADQIAQIKKIIAELEGVPSVTGTGNTRLLPLNGQRAERELETAAQFWRQPNPIILFPSSAPAEAAQERIINGESPAPAQVGPSPTEESNARYLTDNLRSRAAAIRCQVTPRGLLLQSDDAEALDKFEEHLRTLSGQQNSTASPPIVFYLKYTKPADALRMLAELLDGGRTASDAQLGSLVNAAVSSGFYLGSIVTSRDGTATLSAGTITIVADSRLNRLIAQGTHDDIERIERYLAIVDKDSGLTSTEVYGTSHVIELVHTRASDVATALRSAYGSRISAGTGSRGGNPSGGGQQRRPRQEERRGGGDNRNSDDNSNSGRSGGRSDGGRSDGGRSDGGRSDRGRAGGGRGGGSRGGGRGAGGA